jgi:hypothetical protein
VGLHHVYMPRRVPILVRQLCTHASLDLC